jgi:transcription initiation factor TFIIB
VDPGREWRDFADSTDEKSRVSVATEYLKDGLGTTIAGGAKTGAIGKWQSRLISTTDRNLLQAFDRITTLSDVLNVPETIKDKAKEIYAQFEEKRPKSMRYKTDAIVAAIIYMACKEEDYPRTFKELSRQTDIIEKEIRKYYRVVSKLLERQEKRTSPSELVNRFCSKLGLPWPVITKAQYVADQAMQFVEGKSPSSIAAASILFVCKLENEKRYEKDIADAASISPTTIRNVYKDLLPHQDVLMPKGTSAAAKEALSIGFSIPSTPVSILPGPSPVPLPVASNH